MNNNSEAELKSNDILSSSLYRNFIIAFALMAIVPLLVFGYFITTYIVPVFATTESLPLVTGVTIFVALIGFFMMRKVLLSFLKLKKYANSIAQQKLISVKESLEDRDLDEMISSFNRIISSLLSNQRELKHQNDLLQQRYEEIRKLGKIKEDLVRMIAHDVRNFIMIIAANIEMLATGQFDTDPARKRKYLQELQYSANALNRMIDNMLHIERMESGEMRLNLEPLDLGDLSRDCIQPLRPLFEAERKRIVHDVKSRPKPVSADRDLMGRVVSNLLWNANQHTSEGGCIALLVGNEPDGRAAFLSVSDDGEGIPESIRGRIFEKFFQGESSRGKKGTAGLGLAFCEITVSLHGGTINVESEEGRGSTFTIRLPVTRAAQPSTGS